MFDLYDLKKLEENLNTFKIEGEKEMYIFRGNKRYIISSSIFFIISNASAFAKDISTLPFSF